MSDNYSGQERRKFRRLKVNITVIYNVDSPLVVKISIGDRDIEASTVDISEEGMGFSTKHNLPAGALLSLKFMVYKIEDDSNFKLYKFIKIKGEVKSNVLVASGQRRIGVMFKDMEDDTRQMISEFVHKGFLPDDKAGKR